MHLLVVAVIAAIVSACASIGRPEGGPRDTTPPKYVSSRPAPGQLRFEGNKVTVYFDENIQLDDAFNKVVVSPVQEQAPSVSSNGKRLTIELRDTMIPDMTYTIDCADAIKDLNEGNILDGFALDFSTGDSIDTLRISGMVLEARTLEPAQGMLVGVHSNLDDSAITTIPFDRIARTNQYGQFTIRNLKPGSYRVFALNDINRDYKWDRSEDVAFCDYIVEPEVESIVVSDTLSASDGGDSTVTRPGVKYLPNDVLLSWFNEGYKSQYLQDYSRADRRRVTINFAAPSDTLPEISIVGGADSGRLVDDWALAQVNPTRDSLVYWIRDTAVVNTDSLRLSVKYLRTDTNDQLSWQTDTLRFFFRDPDKGKKKKDKKNDEEADTVVTDAFGVPQPKTFLNFAASGNSQEVYLPLLFTSDQPIESIDPAGVRLEMLSDTIWVSAGSVEFVPDSLQPLLRRKIGMDWEAGAKYRLTVDSAAVMGIYGEWNRPVKHEFVVRQLEDYSNLIFNISGVEPDSAGVMPSMMVELLGSDDKPVRAVPVVDGKAVFKWLNPSTYYARLYIDANSNGQWDTGSLQSGVQPEEVYYYNKKLQLKKNWDVEQTWNIYELPVDAQKPLAIKKNKPKKKAGERDESDEDNEEEYDEFGNPIDANGMYDPNDRSNINNRRPGTSGSMMRR